MVSRADLIFLSQIIQIQLHHVGISCEIKADLIPNKSLNGISNFLSSGTAVLFGYFPSLIICKWSNNIPVSHWRWILTVKNATSAAFNGKMVFPASSSTAIRDCVGIVAVDHRLSRRPLMGTMQHFLHVRNVCVIMICRHTHVCVCVLYLYIRIQRVVVCVCLCAHACVCEANGFLECVSFRLCEAAVWPLMHL